MAQIVCLANSYKRGGRCIAGVDLDTGQWVRPIGRGPEGAIGIERLVDGHEPKLLDILEIPIGGATDNLGCQPENRLLNRGRWCNIGSLSIDDVLQYVGDTMPLLHSNTKRVNPAIFENMPRNEWRSLQLIRVAVHFNDYFGKPHARFDYNSEHNLKVTDPVFNERHQNLNFKIDCLLTVSMAAPYKAPCDDIPYCYKMVAGAIKLEV
ncbi:MAG: hypothetical protein KAS96_12295 [Planctomycetes bacterium]|nr:hypothetical protein [Planctomycetota bacterium]